jgi:hypothetical protein
LTERIASRKQTWALIGRDKGCSFPGCDQPPEHCQRHHVIPWWLGGATNIANLTLACKYHHRGFAKRDWHRLMIDGYAAVRSQRIPPAGRDPDQTPLQKRLRANRTRARRIG